MAFNDFAMFFYRSYCDIKVTGYSLALSTDYQSATLGYAVDRDLSTAALTSGKNSDATNADFIVDLEVARSIDTIFVRSNFSTFTISWSNNGSSWTAYKAYTGDTSGFVMARAGTITARYIKVACTATYPANQEKALTEISITAMIAQIAVNALTNPVQAWERVVAKNLKGKSIQLITFPQFPNVSLTIEKKNMLADYATYETIKDAFIIDACLVYLYFSPSITQLGNAALYLMNDTADRPFTLSGETLAAGADGSMQLEEA